MLNVVMSDAGQVAQVRPHMHRGKSGSVRANDEPSIGSCAVKCGRCVSICLQLIPFCLPRHVFAWCAVRSIARKHDVGCTMSTHRICCVFNCVLISSVFLSNIIWRVVCRASRRAFTIDVHPHRFLDVHSLYKTPICGPYTMRQGSQEKC